MRHSLFCTSIFYSQAVEKSRFHASGILDRKTSRVPKRLPKLPVISGSPGQSSLVWRRPSLLSLSLRGQPPNRRSEKEVSLFPQPRQSTCPLKHRRNYHLSLFLSSPSFLRAPAVRQPTPVGPACQPASLSLIFLDKGSLACQPVGFHGPTSLPGIQAPSAVGFPQPCRACVRACARMHVHSTAPPGSSKTLRDPLPCRSRDRECRSASNLPVSCISCISCTS